MVQGEFSHVFFTSETPHLPPQSATQGSLKIEKNKISKMAKKCTYFAKTAKDDQSAHMVSFFQFLELSALQCSGMHCCCGHEHHQPFNYFLNSLEHELKENI